MGTHKNLGLKLLQTYARSFPLDRGKQRVASWLWKPLSHGQYQREATLQGSSVSLCCDLTQFIQRQLYLFGSYEEEYCAFWIRRALQANTIFDIGANIGLYSLLAAEANPLASIHAFEPTPELIDRFKANLTLNRYLNVRVNAVAIGSHEGTARLRECRGSDGSNEGMNYVSEDSDQTSLGRLVPVLSLDQYCSSHGVSTIDLMKIDIEGGEYDALVGASERLEAQAIRCLMIEFTDWAAQRSGHSTADLKVLLESFAYVLHRLKDGRLVELGSEKIREGENLIAIPRSGSRDC